MLMKTRKDIIWPPIKSLSLSGSLSPSKCSGHRPRSRYRYRIR